VKKTFLAVSAGRSDYDRFYPLLMDLKKSSKAKLFIYLTQANYNSIFGSNIKSIKKDFNVLHNSLKNKNFKDSPYDMIQNLSLDISQLSKYIKKIKPDIILVMGDRYEMLVGPLSAIPFNIPVVHFFGGAVTEGAIDELVRHGITKMSHYHFVLLEKYKKRLQNLGEENWRIKTIGMPTLNKKMNFNLETPIRLNLKSNFDFTKPFMILTFHPVTLELTNLSKQINELIKAIKLSKLNVVLTYPNSDPKFNEIIRIFKVQFKNNKKFLILKSAGEKNYFKLMKKSKLMIGNSSSGIVEAASFKLPVVNIGSRQTGKFKPKNVIDTNYSYKKILSGIKKALSNNFKNKLKNLKNPYESKIDVNKITKILIKLSKSKKLIKKRFIDVKR
tara:strand:- start:373 stop:1533 length:1161 start_codon:yes stop_codon:yes gene_type:complete